MYLNTEQPAYSQRIAETRKAKKMSMQALADAVGLAKSTISMFESGKSSISIENFVQVCKTLGLNISWVITGIGPQFEEEYIKQFSNTEQRPYQINSQALLIDEPELFLHPQPSLSKFTPPKIEIHSITVDAKGRENIHMVSTKAAAGYRTHFVEPEFLRTLPAISLPTPEFRNATFRCFQVQGDSMSPGLQNGDYVIAQLVTNWAVNIKEGYVHVIVTRDDVLIKRTLNRLMERGKVVIQSDNDAWPTDEIDGEDILEVWFAKAKISYKFPNLRYDTHKKIADLEADLFEIKKLLKSKKLLD